MSKTRNIASFYKILALYEDIENNDSVITLEDYLSYLDRLYVQWLGKGNNEIYDILNGLKTLGIKAGHRRVKSMVFHLINLIEKGEEE